MDWGWAGGGADSADVDGNSAKLWRDSADLPIYSAKLKKDSANFHNNPATPKIRKPSTRPRKNKKPGI